ncbi:MAG: tRNA (cytidine(34)-2'-O)-methyltransferase [Clostridia bacterium]|nr:tRNA (cytidine(34)-2'-O)-methyltransferase [Clostridia bacterium]
MFNVVLLQPEIPQNTGNIARTCAATNSVLHLVEPLGFDIDEKAVKRAGLDYWDKLTIKVYENLADFYEQNKQNVENGATMWYASTKAKIVYSDARYKDGDYLIFGRETKGIDEEVLAANYDRTVRIPMWGEIRSLNLSNSVAIVLYEALRQNGFDRFTLTGKLRTK